MAKFIEIMVAMTEAMTRQSISGERTDNRKLIDQRTLKIDLFSGKAEDWDDWSFTFRQSMRAQNAMVYDGIITTELLKTEVSEVEFNTDQKKVSGEVYDILVQTCRGEALGIVKAVEDFQGLRAWQRLHTKYNPKTMASLIKILGAAAGPAKVTDVKEIESRLNKWEDDGKTNR